ncbi:MAG TPA: protoporphyrinogen oxidase HemJ [Gammaproteobacteria bacterium]|nr:protoporphyrinogen oxidase HemJ [Gammaproteobacteria bacterium]|tara:strand:- start:452 stop:883 length:432 start_codon:yes stop_codon:yes gene_type:complete
MYLWVKALHIIFMVTWFAGLFYLPRLFVYHTDAKDVDGRERFKIMEQKLYYRIMTPGAALTIILGVWLMVLRGADWVGSTTWLHIKLVLVGILIAYHLYLGHLITQFRKEKNNHNHVYYRWLNEFPVLILISVTLLAVVKPTI